MAVSLGSIVEGMTETFTGFAYALTFFAGLLTIAVERFLYRRGGYLKEATITAVIGWTYVVGGTLLYLVLQLLRPWV